MTQTIAEKIISQHAGQKVQAGDLAIVPVDGAMATDTSAPLAIKAFREMGGTRLWDASKMWLVRDHAVPAPNERISNLHQMMRTFAREMGCKLYEAGQGICHQLLWKISMLDQVKYFWAPIRIRSRSVQLALLRPG